jgi:hypothetical protein
MIITTPAWALWFVNDRTSANQPEAEIPVVTKTVQRVEVIGKNGEPQWVEVEFIPAAVPEPSVVPMILLPALALLLRRSR